jgi:tetratricopeptide (TPR) repeat protein
MGRVDDAVTAYRMCAERFPASAAQSRSGVFYEIGRLYASKRAWDKAQESFEEAIAADAANYVAYFALGGAFEEQDRLDRALTSYKQALDISPSSDAAQEAIKRVSLVVSAREEAEKNALAARSYDQALKNGTDALEGKRYDEASRYFSDALAIRSDDANAWAGFAEARANLGDSAGAIKSLERALERDPEHQGAKSKLAAIEEAQKKKGTRSTQNTRRRRSNTQQSPRSSKKGGVSEALASTVNPSKSRKTLFEAGLERYRQGEYPEAFASFAACLRSPGEEPLPDASLAGSTGPLWKLFQFKLTVPHEASLLAESARLNPADRDLYVNLSMAGAKMGLNRQAMRAALNEIRAHAAGRNKR